MKNETLGYYEYEIVVVNENFEEETFYGVVCAGGFHEAAASIANVYEDIISMRLESWDNECGACLDMTQEALNDLRAWTNLHS